MANGPNDPLNPDDDTLPAPGDEANAAMGINTTDGSGLDAAIGAAEALDATMASANRTGKGGVDIVR